MPANSPRKASKKKPAARKQPPKFTCVARKREYDLAMESNAQTLASMGFFNPSTSAGELIVEFTDFFDSPSGVSESGTPYQQWFMSLDNPYFPAGSSASTNNIGKILRVSVYALPQFNLNTSTGALTVIAGVPVKASGTGGAFTAAQRSTTLTPTSVSDWVKVLEYKSNSIFADSNVTPLTPNDSTGRPVQVLAGLCVLNPDTLDPITTDGSAIQYMMRVKVAYTLPQITSLSYLVEEAAGPTVFNSWTGSDPASSPILASVTGVSDKI